MAEFDIIYNEVLNKSLWDAINKDEGRHSKYKQLHDRYTHKYNAIADIQSNKKKKNPLKIVEALFLDFVRDIVDARTGYMGSLTTLDSKKLPKWTEEYSNTQSENVRLYSKDQKIPYITQKLNRDDALFGEAFKLLFVNKKERLETMKLNPMEVIWVNDASLTDKPQSVMRYYKTSVNNDERYRIELYDSTTVYYILENSAGQFQADLTFTDTPIKKHGFSKIPIIKTKNNEDSLSNIEAALSIIDNYGKILSDFSSDLQGFANAYIKIKNGGWSKKQNEDLETYGIFTVAGENSDVSFMTKEILHDATSWFLEKAQELIYKYTKTVDFTALGTGYRNLTEVQLRLLNMESDCKITETETKNSLIEEIELSNEILSIYNQEIDLEGLSITMNRNLPIDLKSELEAVASGVGIVSRQTLLGQLSFISDPEAELELLKSEYEDSLFTPDEEVILGEKETETEDE